MKATARGPVRVLVVDDSAMMRHLLCRGLAADPGLEVVGEARDAYEARDLIVALQPEVITLDVEMPRMDGVTFLRRLMPQYPLPVVMVSALTRAGAEIALDALAAGAVDVVCKPSADGSGDIAGMIAELRTKLRIAAGANVSAWKRAMLPVAGRSTSTIAAPLSNRVIAIGASTGGTDATQRVLAGLPRDTPGVVVVQHMPAVFTAMYADRLNQELGLRVVEATDGDALRDGTVYIAPGEQQCAVVRASGGFALRVRRGPKVSGHCPSVDVMFGSVAVAAGSRAVGAILTGMGRDGAEGLLAMRRAGARTFAQDEATSVVYGMPREAWDCGAAEARVGVDAMADAITRAAGETVAPRVVAR